MEKLKVTVGPSAADKRGFAEIVGEVQASNGLKSVELKTPIVIALNKSIGLSTVGVGRATLERDLLRVIRLEQAAGKDTITVVATNASGREVKLMADTQGALRDYTHVQIQQELAA